MVNIQTVITDSGKIALNVVNQDIKVEKKTFDIGDEVEGTIIVESFTQRAY